MTADSDSSKWQMVEHTRAKHKILKSYLAAWFPILSTYHGRVVYLDGFAGRGRYDDGSEGSPQLALRTLLEHHALPRMSGCEFVFIFIEKNAANAKALEVELSQMKEAWNGWPSNIKWEVYNASFDDQMDELFQMLRDQGKRLAPTFAFVDPFGYTRFPMELLAQFGSTPRTELFINFMVGFVQRFVSRDGQQNAVKQLYGMEVDEVLEGYLAGDDRIEHLVDVYMAALREQGGFPHVQRFYMLNETGNVSYALVHATQDKLGVQKMKQAMWAVDPSGSYRFSDRLGDAEVLFVTEPDLRPLQAAIAEEFAGASGVTGEEVRWFAILNTPFRETHATKAMKKMEQASQVVVYRPPGKRQFSDGVTLSFPTL